MTSRPPPRTRRTLLRPSVRTSRNSMSEREGLKKLQKTCCFCFCLEINVSQKRQSLLAVPSHDSTPPKQLYQYMNPYSISIANGVSALSLLCLYISLEVEVTQILTGLLFLGDDRDRYVLRIVSKLIY